MDWEMEIRMVVRAVVAAALGGFVGWERHWHGREAGIRTYAAVAVGACVFALISTHVTGGNNPHVIAAGVVTGIGFLGAGVIVREQGNIIGLTTAATLWATGSVGLAVGYGMYLLGALVAVMVFALLAAHHLPVWVRFRLHPQPKSESTSAEPIPRDD